KTMPAPCDGWDAMVAMLDGEAPYTQEQDLQKRYKKAYADMKKGNLYGTFYVGMAKYTGKGTAIQRDTGIQLIKQAAKAGNPSALSMMLIMNTPFYKGQTDFKLNPKRVKRDFYWGMPLVVRGFGFAQYTVGNFHFVEYMEPLKEVVNLFYDHNPQKNIEQKKAFILKSVTSAEMFQASHLMWLAARQNSREQHRHFMMEYYAFFDRVFQQGRELLGLNLPSIKQPNAGTPTQRWLFKVSKGRQHLLQAWEANPNHHFTQARFWLEQAAKEPSDATYHWASNDLKCIPRFREMQQTNSGYKK
ncbi:hypothetical protein V5T57_17420, partial [Magnetococcus sp. PR-3]